MIWLESLAVQVGLYVEIETQDFSIPNKLIEINAFQIWNRLSKPQIYLQIIQNKSVYEELMQRIQYPMRWNQLTCVAIYLHTNADDNDVNYLPHVIKAPRKILPRAHQAARQTRTVLQWHHNDCYCV